jgi:hypothetical protein
MRVTVNFRDGRELFSGGSASGSGGDNPGFGYKNP